MSGVVYQSIKKDNLNHAVTDPAWWLATTMPVMADRVKLGASGASPWIFSQYAGANLGQEDWVFWARNADVEGLFSTYYPADDAGVPGSSITVEHEIANTDLWLDLETNIVGLDEAVADLETIYGDTVSAAQSAAEAATAMSEAIQAKADAIIAQGGAVSAKNDAQIAATSAETAKSSAQTFANSASTSATNAAGSASTASQSAGVATTAKDNAAGSASAAATSASSAASYATSAENASTAATSSKLAAQASKDSAATSASAAATSATNASASATAASQSATASNMAKLAAETAKSAAETARTEAVQAKNDASGSSSSAATSATTAANSATTAGNSATAAAGSATLASTKATEAGTASQAAQTARVAAESARDGAVGSASAAATSANTAQTSATNAGTSANSASQSATNASTSASNALTYRNQASQSATDAQGYATASAQDYSGINARLDNAGGTGVSVEQKFTAQASDLTGLKAQWSVKIDNNGHVSGFGLSSEPANGSGASTSYFIVRADRFAIGRPGYGIYDIPFSVDTSSGIVRLNEAHISKIIRSTNYNGPDSPTSSSYGSNGWLINQDGTAVFNTVIVRSGANVGANALRWSKFYEEFAQWQGTDAIYGNSFTKPRDTGVPSANSGTHILCYTRDDAANYLTIPQSPDRAMKVVCTITMEPPSKARQVTINNAAVTVLNTGSVEGVWLALAGRNPTLYGDTNTHELTQKEAFFMDGKDIHSHCFTTSVAFTYFYGQLDGWFNLHIVIKVRHSSGSLSNTYSNLRMNVDTYVE